MKVETVGRISQLMDEQLDQAIEAIEEMLARRSGEASNVIEGRAEPATLPRSGQCPEAAMERDSSWGNE